jgi:hypothetical protein
MNGISNRTKGASFQEGENIGCCITGYVMGITRKMCSNRKQVTRKTAGGLGENKAGMKEKNYPLYQKKDKANGEKDKAGSLIRKFCVIRIKFPQEDLLETKALRKSVGGLHRSIGFLKRDDSNSPYLISEEKITCTTKAGFNLNGILAVHSTGQIPPFFYGVNVSIFNGIYKDVLTVFR